MFIAFIYLEYYTPEMMGIRVDQEVLGELIK